MRVFVAARGIQGVPQLGQDARENIVATLIQYAGFLHNVLGMSRASTGFLTTLCNPEHIANFFVFSATSEEHGGRNLARSTLYTMMNCLCHLFAVIEYLANYDPNSVVTTPTLQHGTTLNDICVWLKEYIQPMCSRARLGTRQVRTHAQYYYYIYMHHIYIYYNYYCRY